MYIIAVTKKHTMHSNRHDIVSEYRRRPRGHLRGLQHLQDDENVARGGRIQEGIESRSKRWVPRKDGVGDTSNERRDVVPVE